MAEREQPEDVSELLEEESAEEEQFRLAHQNSTHLQPGAAIGMVHSPTTDTLDSVYLDAPISEAEFTESGEISLDEKEETKTDEKEEIVLDKGDDLNVTVNQEKTLTDIKVADEEAFVDEEDNLGGIQISVDRIDLDDVEVGPSTEIKEESQPSLTKYFGSVTTDDPLSEDFFSSLPPVEPVTAEEAPGNNVDLSDQDNIDDLLDMIIDDSELQDGKNMDETKVSRLSAHERQPDAESVLFEMSEDLEEKAPPVDIEDEKEEFESFTADLADTETMDALGMSPATTSFMTERNIQDYFRQGSQQDSVRSLGLERQVSNSSGTSGKSAPSQDQTCFSPGLEENQSIPNIPESIKHSQTPTPSHTGRLSSTSEEKLEPVSEIQQGPASQSTATLPQFESPVHHPPVLTGNKDTQILESDTVSSKVPSLPATPIHKAEVLTFQAFSDSTALDEFSASLQMSDEDRRHDAWIPSDETKNILINMATSPPGTYIPSIDQLCLPSLVVTDSQGDPVKDLVYRYMGEQEALKRQVLTADKVSQDTDGLKELIVAGCLRSAVDLTGSLLMAEGFGEEQAEEPRVHSSEILQLWYCRFALLMKLRLYNVAETEFQAFKTLDTPDIYYDFYPQIYPGKRGSMVAFGMRLLHAELPHHLGRSQETLDRYYYILAVTQKILKNLDDGLSEDGSALTISQESRNVSKEMWSEREKQVLYCIGNTLVAVRDFDAALSLYETLLETDASHKLALLSGMGRIHLQIGNLHMASDYFKQVASLANEKNMKISGTLLINRGFEAMCQNNFSEAYQLFRSAVQEEPENTAAVNNMSVCCLYLGRLKEALKALEALVHGNPDKNLHEGILFNLCTLYELESSRALHKKQALLDLVSKHKGDGFPVVCLKMS